MTKKVKALVFVLGICLLSSILSCNDEFTEQSGDGTKQNATAGSVELSLSADFGEEEFETDSLEGEVRSFTLYSGPSNGRNRPHITIGQGEQITARLFFAYTEKDANGNPIGTPTVISTPIPITFTAKTARTPDHRNKSYAGLEALRQTLNIPNFEANKNKVWFVTGVVGGTMSNNKLSFDPNSQLMGKDNDLVTAGRTKSGVNIPYTFPWTRINFETIRKTDYNSPRTVDAAQLSGLRFLPRGMFVRFMVRNESRNNGVFVLKNVNIPVQTDYAPYASPKLTGITLEELTGAKHMGFVAENFTTPRNYSFHYGRENIPVLTGYNQHTGPTYTAQEVDKYTHFIGTVQVTNPYIVNPVATKGYFWLWFADLKSNASKIYMEISGDALGNLKPRHRVANGIAATIPTGKVGYTIARDFKLLSVRPFIPLEFVARGNLVRPGYPGDNVGFEVGPDRGYPGNNIIGLNFAGGSFGEREYFNMPDRGAWVYGWELKYTHPNRFLPTADDWRTIIPIFRGGRSNDVAFAWENDNPNSNTNYTAYVGERNTGDVIGIYESNKLFGSSSKSRIYFNEDEREEQSRFRIAGNTTSYTDARTKARYGYVDDNMIYGTRWYQHNASNETEKRKYFSAYRLSFVNGGIKAEAVYIGAERLDKAVSDDADRLLWFRKAADKTWWEQKYQEGEVIVRFFPKGGLANSGLNSNLSQLVGDMNRYYSANRLEDSSRGVVTFQFATNGFTVSLVEVDPPSRNLQSANDMLIRYFVNNPAIAYQEWGSRN